MRPFPRAFSCGQTRLHRKKGSLQIDIENLVPIGLTHIEEFRGRKNPCVATEDVDTAMAFDRCLSHAAIVFHAWKRPRRPHSQRPRCFGFRRLLLRPGKIPRRNEHASSLRGKDASDAFPIPLLAPVTITERPLIDVSTAILWMRGLGMELVRFKHPLLLGVKRLSGSTALGTSLLRCLDRDRTAYCNNHGFICCGR